MTDIVNQIFEIIKDFINERKSFTILDISEDIKKKNSNFIRHREIRKEARPFLDNYIGNVIDDYTYTDISVNTKSGISTARLYHHEESDPDDYTNRNMVASGPNSNTITTINDLTDDEDTDDSDDITINDLTDEKNDKPIKLGSVNNSRLQLKIKPRNYDGNVEIPKKAFKLSNISPSDIVIKYHPNSIIIVKQNSFASVNNNKSVRITKNNLRKSNLDNKNLLISVFSDHIVISKQ